MQIDRERLLLCWQGQADGLVGQGKKEGDTLTQPVYIASLSLSFTRSLSSVRYGRLLDLLLSAEQ